MPSDFTMGQALTFLTPVVDNDLSRVLLSFIATGAACYAGPAALKTVGVNCDLGNLFISYLTGEGVASNEKKEGAATNIGETLKLRARTFGKQNGKTLAKAAAIVVIASISMIAAKKLGGSYYPLNILTAMKLVSPSTAAAQYTEAQMLSQFVLMPLATAGETITGLGVIKTAQLLGSSILAGFSYLQSLAVQDSVAKEQALPADAQHEDDRGHLRRRPPAQVPQRGEPGDEQKANFGAQMQERAEKVVKGDVIDIPKALGFTATGIVMAVAAAYLGGKSIQSIAYRAI